VGEHLADFALVVSFVAPRYRYFGNRKSFFVGVCNKLGIERKTITVDPAHIAQSASKRLLFALKAALGCLKQCAL
jgi:hypothetical protein